MKTTETYMTESKLALADGTVVGTTNAHRDYISRDGVRLGSLPHDFYELDTEYQDLHEDTTVYMVR
jgi:hypothetical protein